MEIADQAVIAELVTRMRRVEGQARGVQKMIEENRDCEEIIMQLSAMRAALSKVAITILAHNLKKCLQPVDGSAPCPEAVERAKKIFMKFS